MKGPGFRDSADLKISFPVSVTFSRIFSDSARDGAPNQGTAGRGSALRSYPQFFGCRFWNGNRNPCGKEGSLSGVRRQPMRTGNKPGNMPPVRRRGAGFQQPGIFHCSHDLPVCRGEGQAIPHPCPKCRGTGQVMVSKKVFVKIPAGVDNGSRLRLTGEGEPGAMGDLPGICMSSFMWRPINFSNDAIPTLSARLPSHLSRPPWVIR